MDVDADEVETGPSEAFDEDPSEFDREDGIRAAQVRRQLEKRRADPSLGPLRFGVIGSDHAGQSTTTLGSSGLRERPSKETAREGDDKEDDDDDDDSTMHVDFQDLPEHAHGESDDEELTMEMEQEIEEDARAAREMLKQQSRSALLARAQDEAVIRAFEERERARQVVVPTAVSDVKQMLRDLEEVVTFFGETPGDRRDRLKRFVASAELEGGETLEHVQQVANKFMQFENQLSRYRTADSMQSVQTESFFSEGSEELKEWRKKIAILSLQKARDRLAQQREESISSHVNEFSREQKHSIVQSVRDWTNVASQVGSDRPLSACSISPCGTLMALGSWDESITLWDVPRCDPSSRFSQPLRGHKERITSLSFCPSFRVDKEDLCSSGSMDDESCSSTLSLVSCGVEKDIFLWNLHRSANPLGRLSGHIDRLSRVAFHPIDQKMMISTSFDCTWRLWNVETGVELLLQDGYSRPTYGVAFHPDGSLVSVTDTGAIGRIWDLRTGRSVFSLVGHARQVLGVDFSIDGYTMATGSDDHTVKVWDLRKQKCMYTLPSHRSLISMVKFEPERGAVLFSTSFDGTCDAWSMLDMSPITKFKGHESRIFGMDIAPDSSFIVTCSYDRTFKIWSSATSF